MYFILRKLYFFYESLSFYLNLKPGFRRSLFTFDLIFGLSWVKVRCLLNPCVSPPSSIYRLSCSLHLMNLHLAPFLPQMRSGTVSHRGAEGFPAHLYKTLRGSNKASELDGSWMRLKGEDSLIDSQYGCASRSKILICKVAHEIQFLNVKAELIDFYVWCRYTNWNTDILSPHTVTVLLQFQIVLSWIEIVCNSFLQVLLFHRSLKTCMFMLSWMEG